MKFFLKKLKINLKQSHFFFNQSWCFFGIYQNPVFLEDSCIFDLDVPFQFELANEENSVCLFFDLFENRKFCWELIELFELRKLKTNFSCFIKIKFRVIIIINFCCIHIKAHPIQKIHMFYSWIKLVKGLASVNVNGLWFSVFFF